MPVIARFYGILIKRYFSQSEHGRPHDKPPVPLDQTTSGLLCRRRRTARVSANWSLAFSRYSLTSSM